VWNKLFWNLAVMNCICQYLTAGWKDKLSMMGVVGVTVNAGGYVLCPGWIGVNTQWSFQLSSPASAGTSYPRQRVTIPDGDTAGRETLYDASVECGKNRRRGIVFSPHLSKEIQVLPALLARDGVFFGSGAVVCTVLCYTVSNANFWFCISPHNFSYTHIRIDQKIHFCLRACQRCQCTTGDWNL